MPAFVVLQNFVPEPRPPLRIVVCRPASNITAQSPYYRFCHLHCGLAADVGGRAGVSRQHARFGVVGLHC